MFSTFDFLELSSHKFGHLRLRDSICAFLARDLPFTCSCKPANIMLLAATTTVSVNRISIVLCNIPGTINS